jgi:CubicO group peptidase (beta-lactamase class C family)
MTDVSSTVVHGDCIPGFEPLRQLFASNLTTGVDLGASVSVTINGEFAVDLWGGWSDVARTRPWTEDTLTLVYSTTKMMAALAALILVDRGELDLDAPVAKYWPEFAAQGKGGVLVRHVLSHTSGVCSWQEPVTMTDVCDWDKSTALLATQAPWWKPGTASGYQMICHGHLIGEIVRRITGQKLSVFFAREIAGPLGADFHMGIDPANYHRLADQMQPQSRPKLPLKALLSILFLPNSVQRKTFRNPLNDPAFRLTDTYRQAEMGAANGYGNAHSVSRALSVLANGGVVDGVRLISPKTIDRIFEPQSKGIDRVLGIPITWGVGFALPDTHLVPFLKAGSKVCFWGGYGGSMTFIDLERRITVSFVMNKLDGGILGSPRVERILACAYDCMANAGIKGE